MEQLDPVFAQGGMILNKIVRDAGHEGRGALFFAEHGQCHADPGHYIQANCGANGKCIVVVFAVLLRTGNVTRIHQKRYQEEERHEQFAATGNVGDSFHVYRMQAKDETRDELWRRC